MGVLGDVKEGSGGEKEGLRYSLLDRTGDAPDANARPYSPLAFVLSY